jgi:phthalate 4,5-dioxygenase oxygenase subunit
MLQYSHRSCARESGWTTRCAGLAARRPQDQAITESMGPIMDRMQAHLGSDAMVIRTRQHALDAARALRDYGEVPMGADDPKVYRCRPDGVILPRPVAPEDMAAGALP